MTNVCITGVKPQDEEAEAERLAALTPQERIAEHMAGPDTPRGYIERLPDTLLQAYRETMNPQHPTEMMRAAAQEGGPIPDATDPLYLQDRVARSFDSAKVSIQGTHQINIHGEEVGPSYLKIIEPFDKEKGPNNFWTYLLARWAAEETIKGRKVPFDLPDITDTIQQGHAKYSKAFDQLVAFRNSTLKDLDDAGGLKPGFYDKWVQENNNPFSAYRVMDNAAVGAGGARDLSITGVGIRAAKGSVLDLQNIQQSILRDTIMRRWMADAIPAGRASVDMGVEQGLLARVPNDKLIKLTLTPEELAKAGAEPRDADEDISIARMWGSDVKKGEVAAVRDGVLEKYQVAKGLSDEVKELATDLVKQLRNYNSQTRAAWQSIVSPIASLTRKSVTVLPSFSAKIAQMDVVWQAMVNPDARNTLVSFYKGVGDVFGNTPRFQKAMADGVFDRLFSNMGQDKYVHSLLQGKEDPAFLTGLWNMVADGKYSPVRQLAKFRMAMSHVMPAGRYAQGLNAGEDLTAPNKLRFTANQSQFHPQSYGGQVGRNINATVPFFLAHAKGLEGTLRAGLNIPRPGMASSTAAFYKVGAGITAAVLTNYALNRNKEWYRGLPNWQKDSAMFVHVGDDWEKSNKLDAAGNAIMIPRGTTFPVWFWPPLISLVFSALPRRLAAAYIDHDPDAGKGLTQTVLAGFAPPGATIGANLAVPFLETSLNKNIQTGSPIVSDEEAKVAGQAQYTPYTTGVAWQIGRVLGHVGISAPVVDTFIHDLGGPAMTGIVHSLDLVSGHALQPGDLRGKYAAPSEEDILQGVGMASWGTRMGGSEQTIRDFKTIMDASDGIHTQLRQAVAADNFEQFKRLAEANPVVALRQNDDPRGVAQPAAPQQYTDEINSIRAAHADLATKADAFNLADRAVKNGWGLVRFIESLPVKESAAHVTTQDITPQTPAVTGTDKRQLRDTAYGTLQRASEAASEAARAAGIK